MIRIDFRMRFQHCLYVRNNTNHLARIIVADSNRLNYPPVRHTRWVFDDDLCEQRIWNVQRAVIKGSHYRQPSTDFLHGTFYVSVRRSHSISNTERPIEVNHVP